MAIIFLLLLADRRTLKHQEEKLPNFDVEAEKITISFRTDEPTLAGQKREDFYSRQEG